jgi:hypothetical protein
MEPTEYCHDWKKALDTRGPITRKGYRYDGLFWDDEQEHWVYAPRGQQRSQSNTLIYTLTYQHWYMEDDEE